jgi:hypothetical protein
VLNEISQMGGLAPPIAQIVARQRDECEPVIDSAQHERPSRELPPRGDAAESRWRDCQRGAVSNEN